jgi:hypothetical protein
MVTATPTGLETAALARLLFAGPLQPSQRPSRAAIRAAVAGQHERCAADQTTALASVAQEAGDHPECYAERMRWAIDCVTRAFPRPADPARPAVPDGGRAA